MKSKIFLLLGLVSSSLIYSMDIPDEEIGIVALFPGIGYRLYSKDQSKIIDVKKVKKVEKGALVEKVESVGNHKFYGFAGGGPLYVGAILAEKDWYAIAENRYTQNISQKAADVARNPLIIENKTSISESKWKKLRKKIAKNLCCCIALQDN